MTDCTSIIVNGIDFSNVSNLVSAKLSIFKDCCSTTPIVEFDVTPGSETITVTNGSVTLYSDDLKQSDAGVHNPIADGIYNIELSWTYTDNSVNVTNKSVTCQAITCTLECSIANAIKSYMIDGDRDYTETQIIRLETLYTALLTAITCESCSTACAIWDELDTYLNKKCC